MNASFVAVFFKHIPRTHVKGIYFKGSASKPFNSPIDYVPGTSDIDIHVELVDMRRFEKAFNPQTALRFSQSIERAYARRIARPIHIPDLQVMFLNELEKQGGYRRSPPGTVITLYGAPYLAGADDAPRARAKENLREYSRDPVLSPLKLFYKHHRRIGRVFQDFSWRVSPIGPSVLCLKGVPYARAWGMNRTAVVVELRKHGETALARDYAAYYRYAWDFFLSNETNLAAARKGILAAIRVLRRAGQLSKDART